MSNIKMGSSAIRCRPTLQKYRNLVLSLRYEVQLKNAQNYWWLERTTEAIGRRTTGSSMAMRVGMEHH